MKAIKIALVMILALNVLYALQNWFSSGTSASVTPQISQEEQIPASEGLDLSKLTVLIKEVRSGQELERKLNEKDGLNNLDLNGDDKVDYVSVREFGDVKSKIGYSLTVEPVKDELQEVASVTVELNNDKAEIQVIGNEQIYGSDAVFNDWTKVEREKSAVQATDSNAAPMYSSYFYPRPLWYSPWHFGFYPPYYAFLPIVHRTSYISRTNGYSTTSVGRGQSSYQKTSNRQITNPNQGRAAKTGITRSLQKPTSSQKQFQVTRDKNLKSGGFGRSSTGRSQLASKSSSSSFGSSRNSGSSFGRSSSGSSIFGGSSFRSSGSSSRSFGSGK
ncbi:hypothetical protein KKA14_08360 [bacterium]|nr:hypothetical protein [bacterium]